MSLEDQLLHASLLCGMRARETPVYRLELFAIAYIEMKSKSHQSDFQRALESGVDRNGLWDNFGGRGSAEYVLTDKGHRIAVRLFPDVSPRYRAMRASDFHLSTRGRVAESILELRYEHEKGLAFLDGERYSATEICRRVSQLVGVPLPTAGTSAPRVLYDFAVDRGFEMVLR